MYINLNKIPQAVQEEIERRGIMDTIKEEHCLSDLIEEQISVGDWSVQDKMFIYLAEWLNRKKEDLRDENITPHKAALDVADIIDQLATAGQKEKLMHYLAGEAIFQNTEIAKEAAR